MNKHQKRLGFMALGMVMLCGPTLAASNVSQPATEDLTQFVNPLIGTMNMGNTFPGSVRPFGMLQFSPENTRGKHLRTASPAGYHYDAKRIRGFSLTHLSGPGCAGNSGDIPFLPFVGKIESSPSTDLEDKVYAENFSHVNEKAVAGRYQVRLMNGVHVDLSSTLRAGSAVFQFPRGLPAQLLVRASDSQVGSFDSQIKIDKAARRISGSVTSGNFCGYLDAITRKPYYTVHFVAEFDRGFQSTGSWADEQLQAGSTQSKGGTGLDDKGFPVANKGSGVWAQFDLEGQSQLRMRVAISYVSEANAKANLDAELPHTKPHQEVVNNARQDWAEHLSRITIQGGTLDERTTFYAALYHALMHPNLFSDVNGQYRGFDQKIHQIVAPQLAQYANFSGWDIYRSEVQLLALLEPKKASDIVQSMFNNAQQAGGKWDRWTHNNAETHVMNGDPATASVASMVAFGARDFDIKGAYASLKQAATVPAKDDADKVGCPVMCPGQRPGLADWIKLGYLPEEAPGWGQAADMLELVQAEFALAQLATRMQDPNTAKLLGRRAQNWRNMFNSKAFQTPTGFEGYFQNRKADGTWSKGFTPETEDGFVEGSAAQYVWMLPFNAKGLFEAMGGPSKAVERLDRYFYHQDGGLALTGSGHLHSEMDNEPSVAAPWLYLFAGQPHKTQLLVRETLRTLWGNRPDGIPGNDDLGQMSSWYIWAAMGLYPLYPGRSELVMGSPMFEKIDIHRAGKSLSISAPGASASMPYVQGLMLDGKPHAALWTPASWVENGGSLRFSLGNQPHATFGRAAQEAPPSFND